MQLTKYATIVVKPVCGRQTKSQKLCNQKDTQKGTDHINKYRNVTWFQRLSD